MSAPGAPRSFTVPAERGGARLDAALAGLTDETSRSQLARQIAEGAVSVNGEVCRSSSRKVRAGDRIEWLPPPATPTELLAQAIPLQVLFEDEFLVVVDKPAGMVVHPAPGHEDGTLVNALLAHCQDLRGIGGQLRPGIVHRLDKGTSGVMVVAKDETTLAALGEAFKAHDIERAYEALVVGRPAAEQGRIETLHGRDSRDRKRFSISVRTGKRAVTNWRVLESWTGTARLEARLETGRTHQVRLHFASMGCPILGDPVYARPPRDPQLRALAVQLGRQMLHARRLGFRHPKTGAPLLFDVPPPADHTAVAERLRGVGTNAPEPRAGARP